MTKWWCIGAEHIIHKHAVIKMAPKVLSTPFLEAALCRCLGWAWALWLAGHSPLFEGGNHASCQPRSPSLGVEHWWQNRDTSTNYFLPATAVDVTSDGCRWRGSHQTVARKPMMVTTPTTRVHHSFQPPSLPLVNSISFKLYKPSVVYIMFITCIPLTFCPFSVPLCLPKLTNT